MNIIYFQTSYSAFFLQSEKRKVSIPKFLFSAIFQTISCYFFGPKEIYKLKILNFLNIIFKIVLCFIYEKSAYFLFQTIMKTACNIVFSEKRSESKLSAYVFLSQNCSCFNLFLKFIKTKEQFAQSVTN